MGYSFAGIICGIGFHANKVSDGAIISGAHATCKSEDFDSCITEINTFLESIDRKLPSLLYYFCYGIMARQSLTEEE